MFYFNLNLEKLLEGMCMKVDDCIQILCRFLKIMDE